MYFWRFIDPNRDYGQELIGTLDYRLSFLALLIAIMAALVMLPAIGRMNVAVTQRVRMMWLAAGSGSMAFGIWAMHFTAMLAFSLPVSTTYDAGMTLFSIIPALLGCGIALSLLLDVNHSKWRIPAAALALALGIGAMHYTGMEALRANVIISYDLQKFLLSILAAYVLAMAALYISFSFRIFLRLRAVRYPVAAVVLGLAVTSMHFVAAMATHFYPSIITPEPGWSIPPYGIGYATAIVCAVIVGAFLVASVIDRRLAGFSASLEESEARSQSAIQTMLDSHIIIDSGGCIVSFNPAAEQMFGYTAGEVLKKNVRMLMTGSFSDGHDKHIHQNNKREQHANFGKIREIEDGARRKGGNIFPIELCTNAFQIGEQRYYSGVIRDISNRRKEEERNNMLVAAIEHTAENIVIFDKQGIIRYVNSAYTRQTGRSAKQVIGRNRSEVQGQLNQSLHAQIDKAMQLETEWVGTIRTEAQDGSFREEDVTVSPVRAQSGNAMYFVAITRDVTDKHALERQLSQSQKLESIGQLAAGIAHEINTPSQYVGDNTRFLQEVYFDLGTLIRKLLEMASSTETTISRETLKQMLKDADVDYLQEEIPRAIEQSLEGIGRITKIVRAMKEFSHPTHEKTEVDLNKAIESTVTVASNEWKYVANMDMNLDPGLPLVSCVPGEFNQVILIMVVNASHAIVEDSDECEDSKGVITISTCHTADWVEIQISDTGRGMSEQIKTRIFDPFFTTKEVGKGTGQGLNIAYQIIVEKHRGTITVDSELGKGAKFTIRLPLVVDGPNVESFA